MVTSDRDILVLKRGDALAAKTLEGLLQRGYRTQVSSGAATLLEELRVAHSPIVLVDCGAEEEKAYEVVKDLIGTRELHEYPLIALGKDTDAYEKVLQRYFKIAVTLVIPFALSDLTRAIDFCFETLDRLESGKPSAALFAAAEAPEAEKASEHLAHELYKQFDAIPDLVFAQFGKLRLFERNLDGARFPRPFDESKLKERGLYPKDGRIVEVFERLAHSIGKWGRGHLFRVLFLSSRLAAGIGSRFAVGELTASTAWLYLWSFADGEKDLVRRDYLGARGVIVRKDLCSRLKDSAMKIAVELNLPAVGRVVALMGKFIGREEACADNDENLAANVVVSADLIDRLCFQGGFWNPRAAYSLLRKLKTGKIKDLHPVVLACAIKVLAEAISASPNVLLPRRVRNNPEYAAEAKRISELEITAAEQRVSVPDLKPGMQLRRPLVTFDGRTLLDPGLVLDQDLIWRIWQLSAVRPINGPVVVAAR